MSYSLNSIKGCYLGDNIGIIVGVVKGDTRSLDYIGIACFRIGKGCKKGSLRAAIFSE